MPYVQEIIDRLDELIPGNDPALLRYYALLVLTTGETTTLENVHDAWSMWRLDTRPDHPSLVPFDQLTPEVQELDRTYVGAVRLVARFSAPVAPEVRA